MTVIIVEENDVVENPFSNILSEPQFIITEADFRIDGICKLRVKVDSTYNGEPINGGQVCFKLYANYDGEKQIIDSLAVGKTNDGIAEVFVELSRPTCYKPGKPVDYFFEARGDIGFDTNVVYSGYCTLISE